MARFEVFIPGRDAGMPNVTLTIEAPNWIGALRSGLKSIGEGQEAIANVMCDIKEDNSIHVTDVATRRVFRLRELGAPPPETIVETVVAPPPAADPVTIPDAGPRPISMPTGDAASGFSSLPKTLIEFPVPSFATMPSSATPTSPLPSSEASTIQMAAQMPAPALAPAAAPVVAAPAPAPAAPTPAPLPPLAPPPAPLLATPTPARVPAPAPAAEKAPTSTAVITQPVLPSSAALGKIELKQRPAEPASPPPSPAPSSNRTPGPISPPTPRGVPAPAPKRPSGQFNNAPAPTAREVTKPAPTDPRIGREKQAPAVDVQEAIAAVFDATQDLYMNPALSAQKVADTLLDIALQHIPAESGTFYLADVNGHELTFTAVRGPKAEALKSSGLSVKVGQGIIGFCAQEGVCLVVNDIQKDPRFYSAIAKTIGYQPKDTLCASAEKDGRLFGAVQLINSLSSSRTGSAQGHFDAAHMEVLRFIGLTAAAMLERIAEKD